MTKFINSRVRLVALLAIPTLTLVGCNSSGSGGSGGSTVVTPPPPAPNVASQFGAGFAAAFAMSNTAEAANVQDSDVIPVSNTAEAVVF